MANNDGVWNETETSIKITVLPTLWKIWWGVSIVEFIIILTTVTLYFTEKQWSVVNNSLHAVIAYADFVNSIEMMDACTECSRSDPPMLFI